MINSGLFYVALLLGFLPWPILCLRKGTLSLGRYPIGPYLLYIFMANVYELVGTQMLHLNTSFWFQLSILLELLALSYFWHKITTGHLVLFKRIIFPVVLIIYMTSFFFWNKNDKLLAAGIGHFALFLLVLVFLLIWVRRLFKEGAVINLWTYPDFYFVTGIAFYYFSTLFLFLFSSYIYEHHLGLSNFWMLNVVATLILRLALTLGVWKIR